MNLLSHLARVGHMRLVMSPLLSKGCKVALMTDLQVALSVTGLADTQRLLNR